MFKRVTNRHFTARESDDDDDNASCGTPDDSSEAALSDDEKPLNGGVPKHTARAARRKEKASLGQAPLEEEKDSETALEAAESDCAEEGKEIPCEEHFRGLFHCKLCPYRILLSEKDLATHLASKCHNKREALWNREARKKKVPHKQAEDKEPVVATMLRDSADATRTETKQNKKKRMRRHRENAPPEEIERRKEKFRRKKQRRAERALSDSQGGIAPTTQ